MQALRLRMATLHVRNVPEELYEQLRDRAQANGRSIGAEAIVLLAGQVEETESGRRRVFPRRRRTAGTGLHRAPSADRRSFPA